MVLNSFLSDVNCIEDVDLSKVELIDLKKKNLHHLEFNSKSLGCFLRGSNLRLVK
jgi:hypothetical protein